MRRLLLLTFLIAISADLYSQDTIPVFISANLFEDAPAEQIHLRISDSLTNEVLYDSIALVEIEAGFKDTVYLSSGTFKCEIPFIGALVGMPSIKLLNGYEIPWGYPDYEYYLIKLPEDLISYSSFPVIACDSITSPSQKYTWVSSGIYKDTVTNVYGYDSIMTITLTVNIPDMTVTQTDITLASNETGAIYEWLDCENTYTHIAGATNRDFTPSENGTYAVRVTKNECTDTSSCFTITSIGINLNPESLDFNLYPNPSSGIITIKLGNTTDFKLVVINSIGQIIRNHYYYGIKESTLDLGNLKGIYSIQLETINGNFYNKKIIRF